MLAVSTRRTGKARRWWLLPLGFGLMLSALVIWQTLGGDGGSRGRQRSGDASASGEAARLAATLAGSRVEMAAAMLADGRPDEAVAMLVAALRADPGAEDARELAERVLRETLWHFPDLEIRHPLPVARVHHDGRSALWVGMGGDWCTVARWELDPLAVEAVLFPVPDAAPRSLVIDPTGRRLVIERDGVLLLCDARSMKPVMDLGGLPQSVTPESVIVFSADGLLLAHPDVVPGKDCTAWMLRDAQTGEILRRHVAASDASGTGSGSPRPLTAVLDRLQLRVLHDDGSMLWIPVSPVEPVRTEASAMPLMLRHAQFAADGRSWLAMVDRGPHEPPDLSWMPDGANDGIAAALEEMMKRFPWSRQPGIGSGLLRDPSHAPFVIEDRLMVMRNRPMAPVKASARINAVDFSNDSLVIGCDDGAVVRHRFLPKPVPVDGDGNATPADPESLVAFGHLALALSGVTHDEARRAVVSVDGGPRLSAAKSCDPAALTRLFPRLDFSPVLAAMHGLAPRAASPETLQVLHDRLARADPGSNTAEARVTAFARALESGTPRDIRKCLDALDDAPPFLRRLAESRIAWLEGRKMDAIALWPEPFPDYRRIRQTEDWDGWEQPDFSAAVDDLRESIDAGLASLTLPAGATEAQRDELFQLLTDPATVRSLGKPRLAALCLRAATDFRAHADEAARSLALATIAHNFGIEPAASMRAIAHAHAALGDFARSHEYWVRLITEMPVETQLPEDFAEAAYTAFETSNPGQAMEILLTGTRRFARDPGFALRAGWIALLTDHPHHAYRFLLAGREAGFPADKLEHATVLLAIAAAQSGEAFDADAFHKELTTMNPAWSDPATIEELNWPEELKATLRQLTW
jgi:tetratricopeptide (TPR) repeat protein